MEIEEAAPDGRTTCRKASGRSEVWKGVARTVGGVAQERFLVGSCISGS